jgi:nucleoside-diphosphate-sugar epimerase
MKVTITGANGFIGSHLVRDQLARGRTVCAVDISLSHLEDLQSVSSFIPMQGDIRDVDLMRRAIAGSEVVFHLASAHLSLALSNEEYFQINRDGSRSLVELSYRAGVRRFVHCSSVGVHGEIKNPPANEDSAFHPDLVYEQSKLEAERAVLQYVRETGYSVVILRPVWVYGPGCPRTEKLFRTLRKGRFFYVGSGETLRHCIYISDMVEAFHLSAERPLSPGSVFIIGDPSAVTVRELISQMAAVSNAPEPRIRIPLWFAKPAFSMIEKIFALAGQEPPVSERTLKFFTNNTSFDVVRARTQLGFVAKISLKEGLQLTYKMMTQREQSKSFGPHMPGRSL